jgi:acetyltransferase-like isoleucine patch superfamily enzyme
MPGRIAWLMRYGVLRKLVYRCGVRVSVDRGCVIRHWEGLEIGNDVSIHEYCNINAKGGVKIGNDVGIAHQTSILSANHRWDDPTLCILDNPVVLSPTIISDDVWIGCGCRILAGVTIASRSVVAAGAVVAKNVPSGWLVGGVPAKPIKAIRATMPMEAPSLI